MNTALTWQEQLGAWPDPRTFALRAAIYARRQYLKEYVQQQVASLPVYYFSNSLGSDANAGTQASPMKTMAKANAMFAAGSLVALFKCDDEWNETVGITLPYAGKIGSYGNGLKPFFNCFSIKIPAASWTLVSGSVYSATVASQIGMLRMTGRYGNALPGAAFIPAATPAQFNNLFQFAWYYSLAALEAATTPGFFQSGTTVYVNMAGTALAAPPAMEAQAGSAANGIELAADATWVDNIRCDGWGILPASSGWGNNETVGLVSSVSGNSVSLFSNSDSFFSMTHCFMHYNGAGGGIVQAENCKFGCPTASAAGEATCVNFSASGGHEAYHFHNQIIGGSVPNYQNGATYGGFAAQNVVSRGVAFYAHTNTGSVSCYVNMGCSTRFDTQNWPLGSVGPSLPSAQSLSEVVGFCLDYHTVGKIPESYTPPATGGPCCHALCFNTAYQVNINCRQHDVITNNQYTLTDCSGWNINCDYSIAAKGISFYGLVYFENDPSDLRLWNCSLSVSGCCNSNFYVFWYGTTTGTDQEIVNSVVQNGGSFGNNLPTGSEQVNVTFSALPVVLSHNAYFPMVAGDATGLVLQSQNDRRVPQPGDTLYQAGAVYPDGVALEFDIDWNPRNPATPNIGPRELNAGMAVRVQGRSGRGADGSRGYIVRGAGADA